MKKMFLVFLGVIITSTFIGCETIKGIGRDLKNTGENIAEAVDSL